MTPFTKLNAAHRRGGCARYTVFLGCTNRHPQALFLPACRSDGPRLSEASRRFAGLQAPDVLMPLLLTIQLAPHPETWADKGRLLREACASNAVSQTAIHDGVNSFVCSDDGAFVRLGLATTDADL